MRSTRDGLLCPHRVVDDIGSGFGLGIALGSIGYMIKGAYNSPKRERIWNGIQLVKKRAPIFGGNFAAWMGLFGLFQCVMVNITHEDTHVNQVIAGGLTGGIINMRGGIRYFLRGGITGGVLIGIFNLIEIFMMKSQYKHEYDMRHLQIRSKTLEEISKIKNSRPDLLTCSDAELEVMRSELIEDMTRLKIDPMMMM